MGNIKITHKSNGIHEWIIVRLSAILILLYVVCICFFISCSTNLSYTQWYNFFNNNVSKTLNIITLLFMLVHTWIGVRHILEDYIKSIMLRRLGKGLTVIILHMDLLLGILIIWGI